AGAGAAAQRAAGAARRGAGAGPGAVGDAARGDRPDVAAGLPPGRRHREQHARHRHQLAGRLLLGAARRRPHGRLERHAADHRGAPGRAAERAQGAVRGGRHRRGGHLEQVPGHHAAPAPAGHRRHHLAQLRVELQPVQPRLRAHPGRAGRPHETADAVRLRGGVPVRLLRLRGLARRHHHDRRARPARRVPVAAAEGGVVRRISQYAALLLYLVFLAFPLIWMLSTSLKTPQEMASLNPAWIPREPTLANYADAFGEQDLVGAGLRSLIVAVASSFLTVTVALPAAYALARYRGVLKRIALGWVLVSQVFPFILIIIPLFMVMRELDLVNSLTGLVAVHVTFTLPFALWMLQGYVRSVPRELEEAAAVDGAGRMRAIAAVVAPLLAPGVVATLLFSFISSWNEFLFALVVLKDPDVMTLPLTLVRFTGPEGVARLGPLAAASLAATIPSLIFFAIIQRRLRSGLMAGAVKG